MGACALIRRTMRAGQPKTNAICCSTVKTIRINLISMDVLVIRELYAKP